MQTLPPNHPPLSANPDPSKCPAFNPALLPAGHPKPGDANWSGDWTKCPALNSAFAAAAAAPGPFSFGGAGAGTFGGAQMSLPPNHPPLSANPDPSKCPAFNPALLPAGHPKPGDANWSGDWTKCPALNSAFAAAAAAPGPFTFGGAAPAGQFPSTFTGFGTSAPAFGASAFPATFGAQTFGAQPSFGGQAFGGQAFGDQAFGGQTFGGQTFGAQPSFGAQPFGGQAFGAQPSFGAQPFGGQAFGGQPSFGAQPFGGQAFGAQQNRGQRGGFPGVAALRRVFGGSTPSAGAVSQQTFGGYPSTPAFAINPSTGRPF